MSACKVIASNLQSSDCHIPRHLDYVIAIHTMTSYCLIRTGKLEQALKLLSEAEKLIFQQVKYTLEDAIPPQVVDYMD